MGKIIYMEDRINGLHCYTPELGCVYSWKLWYFPCDTVIHNLVYAAFVYCQIVFISITFPVCRVRVLHHE